MIRVDVSEQDFQPEVIREALRGRVARIAPSTALALLGSVDLPFPDRQSLLSDTITDGELDTSIRAAAVGALARVDPAAARTTVAELPGGSDELLAVAAAAVLGRTGGPEDLPALERIRASTVSDPASRRATFAEALIVHRFGLTDREVSLPAEDPLPAPVGPALPFVSRQPGLARRTRTLASLKRELPWLDPADYEVVELQCGGRLMDIAFLADLAAPHGRGAVSGRPAMPAVVAVQALQQDEMNLALFVLSRPTGQGTLSVQVRRPGGEPVYLGEASASSSEQLEVQLRAVRSPGSTAVSATVRLTDHGMEVYGLAGRQPEEPPRTPDRMTPPDQA